MSSAESVVLAVRESEGQLNGGRLLLRASGTENLVRIMAESEDIRVCEEAVQTVARAVRRAGEEL